MYNNTNYPSIDVIRSKMDQVMVAPELSLGPSISINQKINTTTTTTTSSNSLSSDHQSTETARSLKKRKSFNDHIVQTNNNNPVVAARRSFDDFFLSDGQVKRDRLPLEWEQCLDLKSGKIYFLNRRTAEKVWDRLTITDDQHHHKNSEKPLLELELNISSPTSSSTNSSNSSFKLPQKTSLLNDQYKPTSYNSFGHHYHPIKVVSDSRATSIPTTTTTTTSCVNVGSSNMVALACSNCHLLVILSKASPSCPNCKYVHNLHSSDGQQDFKASSPNHNMKPINTLTLFS